MNTQIANLMNDVGRKAENIDKLNIDKMELDSRLVHMNAEKRGVEETLNNTTIKFQQEVSQLNHELQRTDLERENWFKRSEDLDRCLQAREKENKDIKFDMDYHKNAAQKKEEELSAHLTQLELEFTRAKENINELERTLNLTKTNYSNASNERDSSMKELTLAKNTINDLETRLRSEDMGKARGELSEIGQLLKNHNSRRNEHQSSLRQSMEQLENQVK